MTSDYFPPHFGGVENVTYEISKKMALNGHEIHVLTSKTEGSLTEEVMEGVFVHRIDFIDITRTFGLQTSISLSFSKELNNLSKQVKPDLINAQNIFYYSTFIAARNKEKMNYPLVTTLHIGDVDKLGGLSGYIAQTYEKTIGKYIINKSDRLIAVSQAVRKHALKLNSNERAIDVIPNAIDSQRFKPRDKKNGNEIKILFLGRLIQNKGPDQFIEVARKTVNKLPNVSYTLIGDGPMRRTLEEKVSQLKLNSKIHFLGSVPDVSADLPGYDILVRPSFTEGMPLTLLEGMASGLVVISYNIDGVQEIIQNGVTGILAPAGDIEAIIAGITQLAEDTKLLNAIGTNARKYIENYLNWDKVADMTLESYKKVLDI